MSNWKTGRVDWFDDVRGIGMITATDGTRFDFHYSTIQTRKKSWRSVEKDQEVKFQVAGGKKKPIVQKVDYSE